MKDTPYFELFQSATTFLLDLDGVLTDGSLLVMKSGDELRTMNIRDGYALKQAVEKGFKVAVISGGKSRGAVLRLARLGVKHVLMDVPDKKSAVKKLSKKMRFDLSKAIYIGDDIPDLEAMEMCGIPCCPKDARPEIIAASRYVSPFPGGRECVRDIIEKVLKLQDKWELKG